MNITGRGVIEKGRKPNTWLIAFYLGEKDERGRYKRSPKRTVHGKKQDAYRALEAYRAELEGGIRTDRGTVGEYARKFHEQRVMKSPLAYKREDLEIRHIERLFAGYMLKELSARDIRGVYAKERARDAPETPARRGAEGPLSEDGLHKVHLKLRQILQQAYHDGEIRGNPCDLIDFPKPPQQTERKSLSLEEAQRFQSVVLKDFMANPDGKLAALPVISRTGMRRGEALGLNREDVDLSRSTILTDYQYTNDKERRAPKTRQSKRLLSIDATLRDCLAYWEEAQDGLLYSWNERRRNRGLPALQSPSLPIATGRDGNRLDPNNFDRFFRNYCVDNGFGTFTEDVVTKKYGDKVIVRGKGYKGLCLHELRHTVASLLITEGNLDVKTVQRQLGHAQPSTTLNLYVHAFEERNKAVAEAIGTILG